MLIGIVALVVVGSVVVLGGKVVNKPRSVDEVVCTCYTQPFVDDCVLYGKGCSSQKCQILPYCATVKERLQRQELLEKSK